MRVRTYFWHERVIARPRLMIRRLLGQKPQKYFAVGNAGDVLARDLIRHRYGLDALNDPSAGRRLLVVGSIAHRALDGDILCGVGTLDRPLPGPETRLRIVGLRGPISYEALRAAGHDVSGVRFLLDPGLLIRFVVGDAGNGITPRGVIFIPHHRDRAIAAARLPRSIRLVDVDATPTAIARTILGAELVYASSLHGIIFAHALGRPAVLVRPEGQPLLKYQDYYAAMGLPFPVPLASIADADLRAAPVSPADIRYAADDFVFPDLAELRDAGIAV